MSNLRILSYTTDLNNQNFKLLQNKLDVEILPILQNWSWDFYPKSVSVYETIKNFNSEDIVLVCDAYDVLPKNKLTKNILFDRINKKFNLNKITFNAEKNCYPDTSLINLYPHSDSPWKYLNAGIYVGKVNKVLVMLENLLPKIKNSMDQREFSISFINNEFDITLDYNCDVFQTMYMLNDDDLFINDNIILNRKTNTEPLLFHGNGKSNLSIIKNFL
jgi:hypothetical protein